MEEYLEVVKGISKNFKKFKLVGIPRGENTTVDALATLASISDPELKRIIPVECIAERSIKDGKTLVVTRSRAAARARGEPEEELPPIKKRKSKNSNASQSKEDLRKFQSKLIPGKTANDLLEEPGISVEVVIAEEGLEADQLFKEEVL